MCIYFFYDAATPGIYTLSLHDALPISSGRTWSSTWSAPGTMSWSWTRSEEHTSELQSRLHLVCRLLLEKKNHQRVAHHRGPRSRPSHPYAHSPPHRRSDPGPGRTLRNT